MIYDIRGNGHFYIITLIFIEKYYKCDGVIFAGISTKQRCFLNVTLTATHRFEKLN